MAIIRSQSAHMMIAACDFLEAVPHRPIAFRVDNCDVFAGDKSGITVTGNDSSEWFADVAACRNVYAPLVPVPTPVWAIPPAKPAGAADIPGTAWHPSGNIPQGA